MSEIGRIRTVEFRREGVDTGKAKDIDTFDYGPNAYRQLVAWDPINQEIVSMYRYIFCQDAIQSDGSIRLSTADQFEFCQNFQTDYLNKTVELGRSVVNRNAKNCKIGLFAIWQGLGALLREYPNIKYIFGKVTIPSTYPQPARNLLIEFLQLYHLNVNQLLHPKENVRVVVDTNSTFRGGDYATEFAYLKKLLKDMEQGIPPLINTYLRTGGDDIQYFGSAYSKGFGNAIAAALLLPTASIKEKQKKQFMDSYTSTNPQRFRELDLKSLESKVSCLEQVIHFIISQKKYFLSCPLVLSKVA
ncbi:GNAT family N-acyltransferase [Leptothoe spongobia]|uniref:GNAT family N-acetyltransferase n=1 Tax=Leptothoe spongobia TAU-MAC 1115 TaxID=1967444 RepID=A0A947DB91_9CYAN|nr:GNAT family N-acyltransferase [Leptothoe spongobia]MBT9314062.1 GNAT family N-acetyltransferase [Leptothoe spongobia TAU-MAC 1115]